MSEAAKLAEALREIAAAHIPDMPAAFNDPEGWRERQFRNLKRIAREALAAYEQAQAEPVAWGMRDKTTGLILDVICPATHDELEGDYTIPLFAAPVAQVSQQAAPEQWQPIETAPKDGSAILVNAGGFSYTVEWSDEFDWWGVDDNKLGPFRLRGQAPSHWMPLPQPPKENKHD